MATTTRKTKYERNYENNFKDIEITTKAFRKTDNVERLVHTLAMYLTADEFRMLFATEFASIPLDVVYVDENGNRIKENA
jgi:RNA recognition motif-containing protein